MRGCRRNMQLLRFPLDFTDAGEKEEILTVCSSFADARREEGNYVSLSPPGTLLHSLPSDAARTPRGSGGEGLQEVQGLAPHGSGWPSGARSSLPARCPGSGVEE